MTRYCSTLAIVALLAGCTHIDDSPANVHREMLVLDTHIDTPTNFGRDGWDFSARHTLDNDIAQVDLGRMREGYLDGGFFVIFTEQGPLTSTGYANALAAALNRSDLIDRKIAKHSDVIELATSVAEAEELTSQGKLIAFKSIENSYPLGENLSHLAEFYRRGVRMAGPVHSTTNQLADSSTGDTKWNGLSPMGRKWVAEMNRLGMVIDASHSSDEAFDQMLELSNSPIILSHSSPRHAFDHPRNLDDARVRKLAAQGGAMCMTTIYLGKMNFSPERERLFSQYERIASLTEADQAKLVREWRALDRIEPLWDSNFEDYMSALLHLIKVAGVDHVCFGADWDGGGGIERLMDISGLPLITERLLKAGYSENDIEKMTSGNVLRIMRAAESGAMQ